MSVAVALSAHARVPACADGLDNDGDGLVDSEDPGCQAPDAEAEGVPLSASESRCVSEQTLLGARFCAAALRCWGRRVRAPDRDPSGERLDSCLERTELRFASRHAKTLSKAEWREQSCRLEAPAGAFVEQAFFVPMASIRAEILAGWTASLASRDDNRLRSDVVDAAGRLCAGRLAADGAWARRTDGARLASERTRARERFASRVARALERALRKGIDPELDPEAVAAAVEQMANAFGELARAAVGPEHIPELAESDPPAGASDVPRGAWLDLRFEQAVPTSLLESFVLRCGTAAQDVEAHAAEPHRVVVNPAPELPANSACELRWAGLGGEPGLAFATADAGASGTVIYDRSDPLRLAPFPDDFWIVKDPSLPSGRRIVFPVPPFEPTLRLEAFRALRALTVGVDGWSRQPPIVLAFTSAATHVVPEDLLAARDPMAAIWLVDVDPHSQDYGRRIPYEVMVRSDPAPDGTVDHVAILFPTIDLRAQGQYAVVVTRRAGFGPSAFFEAVRAPPTASDSPQLLKARETIRPTLEILAELPDVPIPPEDVALAFRVSIRTHPSVADLVHIKELALAAAPPSLILPDLGVDPCPAPDLCVETSPTRGLVARGWVELPNYRSSTGVFARDPATALPVPIGLSTVPFVLSLPVQALDGPVTPIMYQHGNPGNPGDLLGSWDEHLDDAGFALVGMQDTLNRDVAEDVAAQMRVFLLQLIAQRKVPDYWNQTGADMIHFLRAVQGLGSLDLMRRGPGGEPEVGSDGIPEIDPSAILYKGYSEGSNHAQRFLPFAPEILAATATVGASRLSEVMLLDDAGTLRAQIGGLMPDLRPVELWVGVSLFQIGYDQQDGHSFLRHLYRQPLTPFAGSSDTTPPSSLWTEGVGDAASNGIRAAALELGIPHVGRAQVRIPTLDRVDAPVSENLGPGLTAGYFQFDPWRTPSCVEQGYGGLPHSCPGASSEARAQRLHFYESATAGAAEIVDPLP